MKEKIFLKKGTKSGRSPSSSSSSFFQFRNLFKFGIILLFWVAFIPLLWHQKTKNADDKANTAKVVKEVPKSSAPAGSVDGGAVPTETPPAASTPSAPAGSPVPSATPGQAPPAGPAPSPPSAQVTGPVPPQTPGAIVEKPIAPHASVRTEVPAGSGGSQGVSREPQGGSVADGARPPIGAVPEARPSAQATGTPPIARGPAGEISDEHPASLPKETSSTKSLHGEAAASGAKLKPGASASTAEKPKPGTSITPTLKSKPGPAAGTALPPATAKAATPKEHQPQAGTALSKLPPQKTPTAAVPADRSKTPAVTGSKPSPVASPGTAPGTASGPPADKTVTPSGGINWVYIVRLGTFQNSAQAADLQKKLQQKGYAVSVKTHQNLQKGKVYYVDLKGMSDAAAAKSQLDKVQREEKLNPVLLKETR